MSIHRVVDPTNGLTIDGNGSRIESLSVALMDRAKAVRVVAVSDDMDAALVSLTPSECRELGAWLLAAADHLRTTPEANHE